jgi:hypothetical protein
MAQTPAERARAYRARKRGGERDVRDASRDVPDADAGVTSRHDGEPSLTSLHDLSRRELERILRSRKELGSTKVAAARVVRDLESRDDGSDDPEVHRLLAWRSVLETLSPDERLTFLREERAKERDAGGSSPPTREGHPDTLEHSARDRSQRAIGGPHRSATRRQLA